MPTDNIATQLAAFAHGLKPDMLPAAVVEQAKLLMLDALGIALGFVPARLRALRLPRLACLGRRG